MCCCQLTIDRFLIDKLLSIDLGVFGDKKLLHTLSCDSYCTLNARITFNNSLMINFDNAVLTPSRYSINLVCTIWQYYTTVMSLDNASMCAFVYAGLELLVLKPLKIATFGFDRLTSEMTSIQRNSAFSNKSFLQFLHSFCIIWNLRAFLCIFSFFLGNVRVFRSRNGSNHVKAHISEC